MDLCIINMQLYLTLERFLIVSSIHYSVWRSGVYSGSYLVVVWPNTHTGLDASNFEFKELSFYHSRWLYNSVQMLVVVYVASFWYRHPVATDLVFL